jgi:hypothetical protein
VIDFEGIGGIIVARKGCDRVIKEPVASRCPALGGIRWVRRYKSNVGPRWSK